jgi:hypothetical protein
MGRPSILRTERHKLKLDACGYHDYSEVEEVHNLCVKLTNEIKDEIYPLLQDEKVKEYIRLLSEMDELRAIDDNYNLSK